MDQWPAKNDFIDFHSHHAEEEEGVFRIFNEFISNQEQTVKKGTRSVGLHPWHIKDFNQRIQLTKILENQLLDESAIMVGECGLDKAILTSIDEQKNIFYSHIQASEKFSKPLLIHCVKAYQELLAIKKEFDPKQAWIIHGFSGSPQLAEDLSDKGFYFSIGHSLLDKPEKGRAVLNRIPLNKLFIETDESNHSIKELYRNAAIYLQLGLEDFQKAVITNFIELFHND